MYTHPTKGTPCRLFSYRRITTTFAAAVCAAAAPVTTAQTITESMKIVADDAQYVDQFGFSVGASATHIVASALTDEHGNDSGSVYVFDAFTGEHLFKLTADDAAFQHYFGWSVAISGTTAIAGAFGDDEGGTNAGAAYLFDVTTGQQLHKLTALDASAHDHFGWSVGISGDTAIVGAYLDDDDGVESGSAYLFDVVTGQQLHKLTALDAEAMDQFGLAVAISGSTAIVGAYQDDENGLDSGSAYLFDVTTGLQTAKLTANDGASNDRFGYAVAIDGPTAIVGSYLDDDDGPDAGSAYLFDTTTGLQTAKLTASDAAAGDALGITVAISGNTAVAGATGHDGAASNAGAAYLFDTTSGAQLSKLITSDAAALDSLGYSVSITPNGVVASAPSDDHAYIAAGSVYLYAIAPPVVIQQPQWAIVTDGETASFSVTIEDPADAQYQWRRDGAPLADEDNISGTLTPLLQIVAGRHDAGVYDCVVLNTAGAVSTDPVPLAVRPDPDPCLADLNLDEILDLADINLFIDSFTSGCD